MMPHNLAHRTRLLWDNAFGALAIVDDHRRCLDANPATAVLFGRRPDDIVGDRIDDFTPSEQLNVLGGLWDDLADLGMIQGPYEMVRADGRHRIIQFRAIRDFGPDQHLIIAHPVVTDAIHDGRRL